jgi:hypothetical protein
VATLVGSWSTFDGVATGSVAAGAGSDRKVIVPVWGRRSGSNAPVEVTGIDWGGQALTRAVATFFQGGSTRIQSELWYIAESDIPSGSQTLTITWSATPDVDQGFLVATYSGVGALNDTDSDVLNSSSASLSLSHGDDALALAFLPVVGTNDDSTSLDFTNFTERLDFQTTASDRLRVALADLLPSSAGTAATTITSNPEENDEIYVAIGVAFNAPVAPTPVTADSLTTATFSLGQPALSQTHSAGASSLTTASPSLDEPALAQGQSLGADNLTAASFVLGEPAVTVVPSVPTLLRVEAESIANLVNFSVQSNAAASGGQLLDLFGRPNGTIGTATFDFSGAAGSYDIILGVFDENDGQSTFSISVEGVEVGSVVLDDDLGGAGASGATFVDPTVVTGITLSPGDEIVVTADRDADEFARFDYIEFVPLIAVTADDLTTATFTLGQPELSQVQDLGANGLTAGTPILESPTLTQNQDIGADNLTAAPFTLSEPAVTQNQGLTADGLTAATFILNQPALSQIQNFGADNLTTATFSLEQPAFAQLQGLVVDDLTAAVPTLAQPSLGQNQSLTASPLTSATFVLGEPVVTIIDGAIFVDSLTTATFTLGQPALAQIQALPASPLTSAPFQLNPPILEQIQALTANGLTSETFTLGQPALLNVAIVIAATIQADSTYTPALTASLFIPPRVSSTYTPSKTSSTYTP